MPRDDDDRPRKSWKEIDSQRDKSVHRKEVPSGVAAKQSRAQRSQAYRSYKSQLNRLFDGGGIPEALVGRLKEAGIVDDAKARKTAREEILAAKTPKQLKASLEAHREAFGFPEDEAVLAKLLDASDESVVLQAASTLAQLQEEGRLKRASSLKARLKTVQMTMDDPDILEVVAGLLSRL